MRARWVEDEMHWHKLPPRAWPPFQPKADELTTLEARAEACASVETLYSSSTDLSAECMQRHFDVATCLTFNMLDPSILGGSPLWAALDFSPRILALARRAASSKGDHVELAARD